MEMHPTFEALMARFKLIKEDPTLETMRRKLMLKQAELVKKIDNEVPRLSQTPQTSPYKRHDLALLKILKDLRAVLSKTVR